MRLTTVFTIQFSILLRTSSATPLPLHQYYAKRNTTSRNVGGGVAIALLFLLFAAIFYYLGTRHERTKSWLNMRITPAQAAPLSEPDVNPEKPRHKRQISCPLAVSSSAPIKPYDDPIEAPAPSLRYYEMPVQEIHEMGLPSPKKQPPHASRLSIDLKPWWLKHADDRQLRGDGGATRAREIPTWFKSVKGSNSTARRDSLSQLHEASLTSSPEKDREDLSGEGRASNRSSLLDWKGLEHIRRIYAERKSKIGV